MLFVLLEGGLVPAPEVRVLALPELVRGRWTDGRASVRVPEIDLTDLISNGQSFEHCNEQSRAGQAGPGRLYSKGPRHRLERERS